MKHHFRKRFLTGLILLAFVMTFAAGCNKKHEVILYDPADDAIAEEKIPLTFFGFKADAMNLIAIETTMQSFMASHSNIEINYEGMKGSAYWDTFNLRDAAGVMDDVIMINHDHVVTMSSAGKLADLSGLSGLENYTDEARGQFLNTDGTVYFLPTCISTYNLYINYDLLEQHGQSIPENWDEFQKCCDYFAGQGIVPIIANNYFSLSTLISSRGLYEVYQQPNADEILRSYNENPALLAEALSPGVEQVAEMIDRGWFDPEEVLVTAQTSDDLALFLQGERPFMITGGWASVRVIAENPDFSYGVHPYPILDDGCVLSIQADTCIAINAESEHLEEAKTFVEYLIQPDVMWEYCDSQASYTPLKEDRLPSEETLIPSTQYLSNGRIVFRSDYRLNLPTEAAISECTMTLLNGGSADEAKAVLAEVLLRE